MSTEVIADMSAGAVAEKLIDLCGKGQFLQAQYELYDTHIVSIDPDGTRTIGAASMHAKEQRFLSRVNRIYSIQYTPPLIAGNFFTTVLHMEIDFIQIGYVEFSEICVYQVENGKIVFEQFFRDLPKS